MNRMMWLASGAPHSGVILICDHADHRPQTADDFDRMVIAFHGGDGPEIAAGKPYFSCARLAEFLAFINDHAASHEKDEDA